MKNYYKFKVETLNSENEAVNIIECKTKRIAKKVINSYNFPSHYRTIKTKNNKLIKGLSRLHKIEAVELPF